MKQSTKTKIKQTISPELSFKLMQIGQLVLELEEEYMHLFGRETQDKIKTVADTLKELADEMDGSTGERMLKWKEEVRKRTAMGFY
jgi:hypothetical protein